MDSGIISCFKRNYKKIFWRNALDKIDNPSLMYKVDQLTAMNWCVAAWNRVTPDTIANCFEHTNLIDVGKTSKNDQINSSVDEDMCMLAARLSLSNCTEEDACELVDVHEPTPNDLLIPKEKPLPNETVCR